MDTLSASHNDPLFPRGPGQTLNAMILVITCIALMIADARSARLDAVRRGISWVAMPVVWTATLPQRLADLGDYLEWRDHLLEENTRLRGEHFELRAQLQKYAAIRAENRRLRELLSSARRLDEGVLVADVVAINQDPYRHQITINKGSDDGVYRGQALVDAFGVVGQVVTVNPRSAVALMITDPDHGIPVELNRTGLQTMAQGRGDGQALRLPFLPGNADVKPGDLLVSSSLAGRFPAGYSVAVVQEIKQNPGDQFKEAIAFPTAHLNQGRQVLLVWGDRSTIPPPEGIPEEPAQAQAQPADGGEPGAAGAAQAKPAEGAASPSPPAVAEGAPSGPGTPGKAPTGGAARPPTVGGSAPAGRGAANKTPSHDAKPPTPKSPAKPAPPKPADGAAPQPQHR